LAPEDELDEAHLTIKAECTFLSGMSAEVQSLLAYRWTCWAGLGGFRELTAWIRCSHIALDIV
jgi:hypothetical protein